METVCFHCQQYVEKLLKAFLTLQSVEAPKTHDLKRLVQLAAPKCPELLHFVDDVDTLTDHAIQSRYPGDWQSIDRTEMQEIVLLAREVGDLLLPKLRG
jgi:HEPN domain-containing protein